MTATADAKKRIYIKTIKPGDRFDIQFNGEESILLRRLEPVKPKNRPGKVRFVKKNGFTVGITDRTVKMEIIKELLEELP